LGVEVEVLVDRSGRVGTLSYLVPEALSVRPGDGVLVPFGTQQRTGLVIGVSSTGLATREVLARLGRRCGPRELAVARELAQRHLVPFVSVASRLTPRRGVDEEPFGAGPLQLAEHAEVPVSDRDPGRRRWLLLRAPLTDPAVLAAQEAARIHADTGAQVLVLAPTVASVSAVLACFVSGAVRLDSRAPQGAWASFVSGKAPVAVGTRVAALYSPKRLGGIVVVDEQHAGHVESSQPYVHAREVAVARASASRCALTLISPAPTPQALGGQVKVVAAGSRREWPAVQLIDRGQLPPSQRLVPPQLRAAIDAAVRDGVKPVVLAERRQMTLRCGRCRALWPCIVEGCVASSCRHAPEGSCPQCSSRTRIPVGFDADRLTQLLPQARPVSLAELGRLRDAGLVVIFDISPAARAAEWVPGTRVSQLLTVAAEAAGVGGRLLVCSWDRPDGVVSQLCRRKDQQAVAKEMWAYVKAQQLPPFSTLVTINVARVRPPRTDGWPGRVFGPRRTAAGEWELVVQLPSADLPALAAHVERLRRGGKVRVQVT
jgi:primosomal protein N'